jgi:hypothetical protein
MTRIEITPVVVEADPATQARRADVVQRLENLGQITASDGRMNPELIAGWQVTIDGATFPVDGYAVEPESGRVLVSLVVAADEVSVRRSPASTSAPAVPDQKTNLRVWGDPDLPDPRANMPGWPVAGLSARAELGEQIARRAECDQ